MSLTFEEDAEPPEHEGFVAPAAVRWEPTAMPPAISGCAPPVSECRFRPGQVIAHFGKLGVVQACDKCFVGLRAPSCKLARAHQPFYVVIMDKGRVRSPEDTRYIAQEEMKLYDLEHHGPPRIRHSDLGVYFPTGFVPRLRKYPPALLETSEFRISAEPVTFVSGRPATIS